MVVTGAPFSLFDASPRRDPLSGLAVLRSEDPIHDLGDGVLLITRYRDVQRVLLDTAAFSARWNFVIHDLGELGWPRPVTMTDGERHRELRLMERPGFTRRSMLDASAWIREIAEGLIGGLAGRRSMNVMNDLAFPLTEQVISRLLGVPDHDAHRMAELTHEITNHFPNPPDELAGWQELQAYFGDVVVARRRAETVGDDMIGLLAGAVIAGEPLGVAEVALHCFQLYLAGIETTSYTIGIMLAELLSSRTRWERVCRDPNLVKAATEEALRYGSVNRWNSRTAVVDTTIDEVSVPAATPVVVSLLSANHDERVFDEPDVFSLDRATPPDHVAFGYGAHLCLGAALSRLELQTVLQVLTTSLPDLELEAFPQRRVQSGILEGWEEVHVVW